MPRSDLTLDRGFLGQQFGERGQLRINAHRRAVFLRGQPLDRAAPLEQLFAGPDAFAAELQGQPLFELLLSDFDGVFVETAQILVDARDRGPRRIGVLDEELLDVTVRGGVQQQAARGSPSRPARPASW